MKRNIVILHLGFLDYVAIATVAGIIWLNKKRTKKE